MIPTASASADNTTVKQVVDGSASVQPVSTYEKAPPGKGNVSINSCADIKAQLQKRRASGVGGTLGCLSSPPANKTPARAKNAAAVEAVAPPTNGCTSLDSRVWWSNRTSQCFHDSNLVFTYYDAKTGATIGTATFATALEMTLSVNSSTWSEVDQITLLSKDATVPALVTSLQASCAPKATTCTPAIAEPWAPKTPIAVGQTLKGTWKLTSPSNTSTYNYHDVDYKLLIDLAVPNGGTPNPGTWESPEIRCDTNISRTNNAGCVVPWVVPTLSISHAEYGSSAEMIWWAQTYLSGHWGQRGVGQPLHRLQNEAARRSNRNAICGTSRFTADPNIPTDSCDEFPFAGTYESGGLNNALGAACAQVTAINTGSSGVLAADWASIALTAAYTGTEKCVRGHIPLSLNSDLGSAYGTFVNSARLADSEGFWLAVVA